MQEMFSINRKDSVNIAIGLFFSLAAFFLVLYQALGEAPDWANYDEFIDLLRMPDPDLGVYDRFEIGFVAINKTLVSFVPSNLAVLGIIAAVAMVIKICSINSFSQNWSALFIALIFYFSRFFPLHEYTQLRAATSLSFLYAATVFASRGGVFAAAVASAAALAFHMSAAFLVPFLIFFGFFARAKQSFHLSLALFVAILVFISTKALVALVLDSLQGHLAVVSLYQEVGFGDEEANPLSFALILDIAMIAAGMVLWSGLPLLMRFVLFLQLLGVVVFYATVEHQVIAFRVREFIGAFWTFFVAMGLGEKYKIRVVTYIFVVANILLYSYLYFVKGGFFVD